MGSISQKGHQTIQIHAHFCVLYAACVKMLPVALLTRMSLLLLTAGNGRMPDLQSGEWSTQTLQRRRSLLFHWANVVHSLCKRGMSGLNAAIVLLWTFGMVGVSGVM